MALDGIVSFFAGYIASDVLDRLIQRVTGETKKAHILEVKIDTIKRNLEEVLDSLREQMFEDFQQGLRALRDAQLSTLGSRQYKGYLKDAIRAFSRCASRRYATGLPKANALIDKAVCHWLLNQRSNAINALREARQVAQEAAKQSHEVYVRVQKVEPIELAGPQGLVARGERWILADVPEIEDGALALIDKIDQVLFKSNL